MENKKYIVKEGYDPFDFVNALDSMKFDNSVFAIDRHFYRLKELELQTQYNNQWVKANIDINTFLNEKCFICEESSEPKFKVKSTNDILTDITCDCCKVMFVKNSFFVTFYCFRKEDNVCDSCLYKIVREGERLNVEGVVINENRHYDT